MTNASWRLINWLSEYAELMLMLRSEASKVFCAMAQMFELYLLHVFYTFSSLNLADVILPQQQQQVNCMAESLWACMHVRLQALECMQSKQSSARLASVGE